MNRDDCLFRWVLWRFAGAWRFRSCSHAFTGAPIGRGRSWRRVAFGLFFETTPPDYRLFAWDVLVPQSGLEAAAAALIGGLSVAFFCWSISL